MEAVLENEKDTQIYSPVRGHPFYSPSAQPKPIQQIKIPSPARHIPVPDFREPLKSKQNDDNLSQSQKSTTSFLSSSSLGGSGTGAGGAAVKGGNVSQLAIMKECDIEKFAQDNINLHSKGIFRKKVRCRCRNLVNLLLCLFYFLKYLIRILLLSFFCSHHYEICLVGQEMQ